MTNNDRNDTGGTLNQPCDTKQHNNKTILGHKVTVQGLDNWHQVCFQWCQQQGQTNKCSMYCFKYKTTPNKITNEPPLSTTDSTSSPPASATTTTTDFFKNIKRYTTDTLKSYSIVVVKGTDSTMDDYIKAHQNDQLLVDPRIHEINIGTKAETAMKNAELLVKKTHDFSKDLAHTWLNNNNHNKWMNGFVYGDTFRIMKDRAVKMMDVARGKYDNDADNLNKNKKSTNQEHPDDNPKTSDTNLDQDTQHDDDNNSKK